MLVGLLNFAGIALHCFCFAVACGAVYSNMLVGFETGFRASGCSGFRVMQGLEEETEQAWVFKLKA